MLDLDTAIDTLTTCLFDLVIPWIGWALSRSRIIDYYQTPLALTRDRVLHRLYAYMGDGGVECHSYTGKLTIVPHCILY